MSQVHFGLATEEEVLGHEVKGTIDVSVPYRITSWGREICSGTVRARVNEFGVFPDLEEIKSQIQEVKTRRLLVTRLKEHLRKEYQQEQIIVRCSSCGDYLGHVRLIPGQQVIGCPSCKSRTVVEVSADGNVKTFPISS